MNKEFEKIIEKLENELKLADEEKLRCARENPLQFDSAKGYANGVANSVEIVKQEAEKYEGTFYLDALQGCKVVHWNYPETTPTQELLEKAKTLIEQKKNKRKK